MLTTKLRMAVAAGISVGIATTVAFGLSAEASSTDVPTLTSAQLQDVGIANAIDVTTATDSSLLSATVTRAAAIAKAQAEIGNNSTDVRVLLASDVSTPGAAPKPVWVVMFRGGVAPFDGPQGAHVGPITYRVTAVVVDDQTGHVLGGFMH